MDDWTRDTNDIVRLHSCNASEGLYIVAFISHVTPWSEYNEH